MGWGTEATMQQPSCLTGPRVTTSTPPTTLCFLVHGDDRHPSDQQHRGVGGRDRFDPELLLGDDPRLRLHQYL